MEGKPFYKSKGFWGGVLSVATVFVPAPLRPVVAVIGGVLGIAGRAQATEPLQFSLPPKKQAR